MAPERDNAPLSDAEGGEKPVREQLRKAHITTGPNAPQSGMTSSVDPSDESSDSHAVPAEHEERGRVHRKRSHEEIDPNGQSIAQESNKNHTRKRSRDSTFEEEQLNNGQRKVSGERARSDVEAAMAETNGAKQPPRPATPEQSGEKRSESAVEAMTSPKTKRSRLHSTTTEDPTTLNDRSEDNAISDAVKRDETTEPAVSESQTESSTPRESETAAKVPPTSGFANTSTVSPFGSLAGSKSPSAEAQTSSSAFAASGFSALAGSSTSGFGAVGKQAGGFGGIGGFASSAKSSSDNEKPTSAPVSSFGGALGAQSPFSTAPSSGSGFGSSASGFGKLGSGSGFGSGLGGTGFGSLGGGGLTSFASGKTATPLSGSSKPGKPFGAPADDEDGEPAEDDDPSGAKSPLATEEEKQDERFYEQELETGEEDEIIEFSARAKLYNFVTGEDGKREWRERGLGVLKFNVKRMDSDQASKPRGRLLMRADGSHRVVLNTPVLKEIKFGAAAGGPPQGGYMYFMGTIDGKDGLELLQLKMKQANALDLHGHITALQEEM